MLVFIIVLMTQKMDCDLLWDDVNKIYINK